MYEVHTRYIPCTYMVCKLSTGPGLLSKNFVFNSFVLFMWETGRRRAKYYFWFWCEVGFTFALVWLIFGLYSNSFINELFALLYVFFTRFKFEGYGIFILPILYSTQNWFTWWRDVEYPHQICPQDSLIHQNAWLKLSFLNRKSPKN